MSMSRAIGRVLFCLIFFLGGAMKLKAVFTEPAALDASLAYMKSGLDNVGLTEHLAALGPLANDAPRYLFTASAFIEFFGGLSLLLGFETLATSLLLLFLVPVTAIMHAPVGANAGNQAALVELMKNLALIGGLFIIASGNDKKADKPAAPKGGVTPAKKGN